MTRRGLATAGTVVLLGWLVAGAAAQSPIPLVATTEDLAALAREVGGTRVRVDALARGYQDPHFVEPKPSLILKLLDARLLVVVGRDLESGWLPPLIQRSRNAAIQPGANGYLDASLAARILEVPSTQVTRAMGDVHALGNPHYWLDPDNGRRIAEAIHAKLAAMSPGDASYFAERLADFDRRLSAAEKRWDALMSPYSGLEVVTYHRSWSNFAERFALDVVGYVEPKPGIPPTPAHTRDLIATMRERQVRLVIVEPYFDLRTPSAVARSSGAQVIVLPPSVGGVADAPDYITLFDYNLAQLVRAIERTGARPHHDHEPHHPRP